MSVELAVSRAFKLSSWRDWIAEDFRKVDLASVNIMDCRMESSKAGRTVGSLYNLIRIRGHELPLQ